MNPGPEEFATPLSGFKILHTYLQNISPWAVLTIGAASKKKKKSLCIICKAHQNAIGKGDAAF